MSAGSVTENTSSIPEEKAGSSPSPALQEIRVQPVHFVMAKRLLVSHHYLHSLPGGTKLAFGVLLEGRMLGAITFGYGPANAFQLVSGAKPDDCLTLTRLWLSDELPTTAESRVIGICLRALKRFTRLKFRSHSARPQLLVPVSLINGATKVAVIGFSVDGSIM